MGLNKLTQGTNMYLWISATFNPVKGICPHDCSYCSIKHIAKRFGVPQKPMALVRSELSTNLGKGNKIFVGSAIDMWGDEVPKEWIREVLEHCREYPENTYIFQSKNPRRFGEFIGEFPDDIMLGTTIESDIDYPEISKAPSVLSRAMSLNGVKNHFNRKILTFVTIEPVLEFNLDPFTNLIRTANPDFVNIGADSKHSGLPEPDKEKVQELIEWLKKTCKDVKLKDNLGRLL